MELSEEQKKTVAVWIAEGLKLSEIQERMGDLWGMRITYMEARFLVDDLKLMPKDPEPPAQPAQPASDLANTEGLGADADGSMDPLLGQPGDPASAGDPHGEDQPKSAGGVTVKVDTITRPGAMVSGSAGFSDGQSVQWHIDQFGRMGMVPPSPGYRPPAEDIPKFQMLLDQELSRMGM
jgi:hypothetical protein